MSALTQRSRRPGGHLFLKYVVASVILVSLVLLGSSGLELYYSYQENQLAISSLQREQGATAAARIDHFIAETERDVAWASQSAAASAAEGLEQRRADYVRLLRLAPQVTEISFLDSSGSERLRASRLGMNLGEALVDLSEDPRFTQARSGQPYFGPVYFRNNSEPYMTIAVAERGANPGVTAAEVNLKFIWDVVSRITIGRAGDAFVVDTQGQLIAHPDISQVLRRSDLSDLPQVQAARAGAAPNSPEPRAAAVARDLSGREVLTSFQTVPTTGWLVIVEQPIEETRAPVYASLQRTAVLLLLGLAAAILGSLVYARRMVAPIQALQAGAARIGAGALDQRISVRTGDELEQLAEEFNRMAAQLQESYAGLERKVEERTHELAEALEQQTATAEVLRIISSSPTNVQPVLDAICAAAARVCGAEVTTIRFVEGEVLRVMARHGIGRGVRAPEMQLDGDTPPGRAVTERRTIVLNDASRQTGAGTEFPRDMAYSEVNVPTGFIAVPLLREKAAIGVLSARVSERPFSESQVALFQAFADQAVIAIENVRLFEEIQEKNLELEVASRHKSEFLANMSHELRTPLNAIIGFSEVLTEKMFGELNERQEDYLNDILTSGRHLLSLINDILDLSKVEAGQMDLEIDSFSLPDALQNGITMVRERAGSHGITLSLLVDPALGTIQADERKVKQVIFNLLSNAVKFTPDGGRIEVRASLDGDEVRIAVQDTGIGIAPEDRRLVFEEFRQVGQADGAKTEGTGLGLALVKRFVEMHGGRVWLESEPGVGSTFTVALPAGADSVRPAGAPAMEPGVSDHPPSLTPSTALRAGLPREAGEDREAGGPAVLLVEDDPHSIDLFTLYLREVGLAVAVARSGEDGLDLARRIRPAAIVLDVLLPGLDGWEFIAQAKADPVLAHTPLIVTTVVDERGKGLALGAAEYLVKPVKRKELLAAIEALGLAGEARGRSVKILAIDDDPMAIDLIEAVLAPEGYVVLAASGGEEGIELAQRELPDLLILDLMMPEVDGFTVVERLRVEPATARIPIVVLTAKTMSREDRARLTGRISFLAQKADFNREAFVELVQRYCQPAPA